MNGFYLFENVLEEEFENRLIEIIENQTQFPRYVKTGKQFYQMSKKDFPEEWIILLGLISSLHDSCNDFDYSLQLTYHPGVRFNAHYDSKHRWEEFIVGINLKSEAELYFTKKDTKTYSVIIPPKSIYILSGESRYQWRHGIKKVKDLRYSITLRKHKNKQ